MVSSDEEHFLLKKYIENFYSKNKKVDLLKKFFFLWNFEIFPSSNSSNYNVLDKLIYFVFIQFNREMNSTSNYIFFSNLFSTLTESLVNV